MQKVESVANLSPKDKTEDCADETVRNIGNTGGDLGRTSGSILGLPDSEFFRGLNIEKAFLGAWGISAEKGFPDSHLLEIALKRYAVEHAREIIVPADSS